MNNLLLKFCCALFLVYYCDTTKSTIKDICHYSNIRHLSSNNNVSFDGNEGLTSSGNYSTFNDTDETACYWRCCNNSRCSIAWHYESTCFTFQCEWHTSDKCSPMAPYRVKFRVSKLYLVREPTTNTEFTGPTTMKTTTVATSLKVLTTVVNPRITFITVHISKNQTITMPVNRVTLTANVVNDKNLTYLYQWTLLSQPSTTNSGKLDNTKTKELKLTDLIVGEYHFQVEVSGNNSYGKAEVFVTVNPAKKLNEPPVAKIEPNNQTVQLPNNVILDGSKSSDDLKIVSYYWELIKGPMDAEKKIKNDESMLNLENLSAGNYTFKLTVKDESGATSFDTAFLEVLPEKDYPPLADPGNNIIVELPVKFVILNGSGSHDDKKIVSYQWTKKSDGLTADIQGVREPNLNLTNLQEGTYTFNLMVTDSSGQSADKDVQVFVKPRTNSHPVAKASISEDKYVNVRLPATEAVLNGSLSNDDEKITKYQWTQIEGQPHLNIIDADKPVAYIYDLKIGVFKFNLTVFDKEKLSSSDTVTLRINESNNQRPKAMVVKIPQYYHLESNLIRINGSISWDDVQITEYKWTREDDSLAVGQILESSDSSSILLLTDLLPGLYKFKLQVFDSEGLFDSFVASLEILPPRNEMNLVELQFLCSIHQFTESRKNAFLNNIQLIIQKKLDSDTYRVVIHLMKLEKVAFKHSITIVFFVTLNKGTESSSTSAIVGTNNNTVSVTRYTKSLETSVEQVVAQEVYVGAIEVVDALNKVRHNSMTMEYQIVRVETYVCQNNCSHHGYCNKVTKMCECEKFWTGSLIRERFGDGRPNCDWSVIYLSIFIGFILFAIVAICWLLFWIKQRRVRAKKATRHRRHKYVKLNGYCDYENGVSANSKVPKSLTTGVKSRTGFEERASESLFHSDSTMTSDDYYEDDDHVTFVKSHHRGDQQSVHQKQPASSGSINTANGNTFKTS